MKKSLHLYTGIGILLLLIATGMISIWKNPVKNDVLQRNLTTKSGVCPPFHLYDEDGNLIDPVNGINDDKPYSPRQTCGKCHDYEKITGGFHFQQGKDEMATGTYAERYQWVSHPGNYGGNWCSPAPLYNFLSKKENTDATEMDMTSFTFITNGCGTCHPGSASFEFDRNGKRYDKEMERLGYTAGGINDYDGDYYKAHWSRSGVGEGDCMLCHLPEYDYKGRNDHLLNWNFKWMATAGSKLATVQGSVKDSTEITVTYDASKFDKEGKLSMHLVREPRNETCLNCHSKPQWKKRGASFSAQTDVHMAKGMKCVDCHPAGSMATDPRINQKETHQVGKGDDPSGMVRNDLDNTMRTCKDCHLSGYLNAPIAKHLWLPSFHLDDLSCQACHIPQRKIKSAMVQVSDVYNPGTKIKPPAKHVWTFYDQQMKYWNHYGELSMFTASDQPSDPHVPNFAKYKGQIFPVNMVHSAWPAIFTEGKPGLDQPKMADIHAMWKAHQQNPDQYPSLALITDDNLDSIPEVNRSEEIDAFIAAVTQCLIDKGYNLQERKVVWVNNDLIYFSSKEFRKLSKEIYESSPYASVYKFSHDVFPAKAGLGSKGCVECHSLGSNMFFAQVVKYPFGEDGNPVYEPQYLRLGMSGALVWLSAVREQFVKSLEVPVILFLILLIILSLIMSINARRQMVNISRPYLWLIYLLLIGGFVLIYLKPALNAYILPERLWFDKNHFPFTLVALISGLVFMLRAKSSSEGKSAFVKAMMALLIITIGSGLLMLFRIDAIKPAIAIAYTIYDVAIVLISMLIIIRIIGWQHTALKAQSAQ
ncbi:MAG: multiheme c-type cytochrome [Bacteroidales bacterium]